MMKKVAFRVDSSVQIGSGHVMRCLTLARQLSNKTEVVFVCRDLEGNLSSLIKKNGFKLILLPQLKTVGELTGYEKWLTIKPKQDAEQTKEVLADLAIDYLVIDSYAIDESWENILRPYVRKIIVIDDLANRKHNCDILLDQNYYSDMNIRYEGLVPENCKLLLGPHYAILRDEFYKIRGKMRMRDGMVKNILVFFGGSDLTNETMKVLQAVKELNRPDIKIKVVVGSANRYKENIRDFCKRNTNMHYFCQVDNMAELINGADLAIGAGGTSTWERCFLGLPAVVIAIAENQVGICQDCGELGVIEYVGYYTEVSKDDLKNCIEKFIFSPQYSKNLISNMISLFLGTDHGVVANSLFNEFEDSLCLS